VHRVPDYAYFNHSVHVNRGIDCVNCHGKVETMEVVEQVSQFTMGACLDCHRNAPTKTRKRCEHQARTGQLRFVSQVGASNAYYYVRPEVCHYVR